MAATLPDEIISDIPIQSKEAKYDSTAHDISKKEFSEGIEILELKRRIRKDQTLLRKLEGTSKEAEEQACQCSLVTRPQPNRETALHAEVGVLDYMLVVMRDCEAHRCVYGIMPNNTGLPTAASSDNLRAWWNDTVAPFDQIAPLGLMSPADVLSVVEQTLHSYMHKLQDMKDDTVGSILSALIQYCRPPQRSFPFDRGTAPPWWPTGSETWWGLQGRAPAELGAPPYRKPHDLRKGWKLSVLAAVIKHMSPRFDDMRSLVLQSKNLQHKLSANDVDTWSKVVNQEAALDEQTKNSLVIAPLDDEEIDSRKRKWGFENENFLEADLMCGDLWPNVDLDMNLIDELMVLYEQERSGGDLGAL